jgi:hypothetical protein
MLMSSLQVGHFSGQCVSAPNGRLLWQFYNVAIYAMIAGCFRMLLTAGYLPHIAYNVALPAGHSLSLQVRHVGGVVPAGSIPLRFQAVRPVPLEPHQFVAHQYTGGFPLLLGTKITFRNF